MKNLKVYLNAGVPVLVWGPPGVGKTASVMALAKQLGLPIEVIIASIREPSDFLGLPVHDSSSRSTRFDPPSWAVRLAQAGRGILFIDEINTAPPAVQAALLRVVLERAVGELQLPDGVKMIAAANPPELSAGGWELSPPLANRFAHIRWELNPAEWVAEFPSYWGNPPQINVPEPVWAQARTLIAAFIRVRPELLLQVPQHPQQLSQAWPSPRSWDNASRMLACILQEGQPPYEALDFIISCVGEGAAIEFATWIRDIDLPDPETILSDPDKTPIPHRSDQVYAVLIALATRATDTEARWHAAWRYIIRCAETHGYDVAAIAARNLARARQPNWQPPVEVRAFLPVLKEARLIQ